MSQSDMSVCEQSFHFNQTAQGAGSGPIDLHSQFSQHSSYNMTGRGGQSMLGGIGIGLKSTASASVHFANLDDAKTLS